MRHTWILGLCVAGCTNDPQYVTCTPDGAFGERCSLEADGNMAPEARGSLYVPVMPELRWPTASQDRLVELRAAIDPAVEVPLYRLDLYDLSVEWTVKNLDDAPGKFRVDLNGANEVYTYDPSLIVIDADEDIFAPPFAGNIPTDISALGTVSGVFREDQLREAAIDLDQISRGNLHPFAAMLTISKNAESFQPLTAYDPITMTGGTPTGPEIPRAAFRHLVRIDLVFRPNRHMVLEYTLRVRAHEDVIHDMGMYAPGGEITIHDPPPFVPVLAGLR
jgi:hypothetical protein